MRLKSFFAHSVPAAIAKARAEFGGDAILISTHPAPPEQFQAGAYEVVFAAPEPPERPPESVAQRSSEILFQSVLEDLRKIRLQQGLTADESEPASPPESPRFAGNSLQERLVAREIAADVASELIEGARRHAPGGDEEALEASLRHEMLARLAVDPVLGESGVRTAVALIGPPGAGKTSALVKLAMHCGLAEGRPVHFVSVDSNRVAAGEQLRCYASILGASFEIATNTSELASVLERERGGGLVLVDTPGYTVREIGMGDDLQSYLRDRRDLQKQLVLPAGGRPSQLSRYVEAYRSFAPTRVLVTMFDEAECCGAVYSHSLRHGWPISWISNGPEIPADFCPASAALIVNRILTQDATSPTERGRA